MNFKCFQDNNNTTNNEPVENPNMKKRKLDGNSKFVTLENKEHPLQIFQNSPKIYYGSTSNCFKSQKQYDGLLNSDKAINDQSENKNCIDIIIYKDNNDLLNKIYNYYTEIFNMYLISIKNLNNNPVFQNERVQFNNQQLTNLDIFLDFFKEVLGHGKSLFDKAKNEKISIPKKDFFFGNIDKKFLSELSKLKTLYDSKGRTINNSIERHIKNIEENSFFSESSCESIKRLIIECNMFIKEVVKHFMYFKSAVYLNEKNLSLIYYECKDISQRFAVISRDVHLECIVVIIKMLIERLEHFRDFLGKINRNLIMFFNSVACLSTDIKWLISSLKDIIDSIDKEYECRELN